MLEPEKYMDLDKSVLHVSSIIIKQMSKKRIFKLDELKKVVDKKINDDLPDIFLISLSLLYITGKVDYLEKIDSITWISK